VSGYLNLNVSHLWAPSGGYITLVPRGKRH